MTLIDYAKYLFSVCGRRFTHLYQRHYLESTPTLPSLSALLSYLKTQTASIFTQIKARGAVHPLSGLPSTETLATLPTALATLSTRKVDVFDTQVEDGLGIGKAMFDKTWRNSIVKFVDKGDPFDIYDTFPTMTSATEIEMSLRNASENGGYNYITGTNLPLLKKIYMPKFARYYSNNGGSMFYNMSNLKEVKIPNSTYIEADWNRALLHNCPNIEKIIIGTTGRDSSSTRDALFGNVGYYPATNVNLIHIEFGNDFKYNTILSQWNPTNALLSDSTSLVEAGEPFTSNLQKFLYNFRQYLFLRLADRTATTALTLTLSSAVYTALTTETSTLAELGITTLTDKEQAAGITLATAYNTWLDTYRAAINWNITNAG